MAVEEQHVEVRGTTVRLLVSAQEAGRSPQGSPTVLYLHGEEDLGASTPFLEGMASSFGVLRPDLVGFNGSEPNATVGSVHELAFATLDLMDALGVSRAAVVGAGLGGWLAADLASIEPGRVERLVLLAPEGLRPAEGYDLDVFLLDATEWARHAYHDPAAAAQAVASAAALGEDLEAHARYLKNRMATAHLAWNPYLHDPRLVHRLHRIACPTLVLWGGDDRIVPPSAAGGFATAIPDARVEVLADVGHLPHLERPGEVLASVRAFLSATGGALAATETGSVEAASGGSSR